MQLLANACFSSLHLQIVVLVKRCSVLLSCSQSCFLVINPSIARVELGYILNQRSLTLVSWKQVSSGTPWLKLQTPKLISSRTLESYSLVTIFSIGEASHLVNQKQILRVSIFWSSAKSNRKIGFVIFQAADMLKGLCGKLKLIMQIVSSKQDSSPLPLRYILPLSASVVKLSERNPLGGLFNCNGSNLAPTVPRWKLRIPLRAPVMGREGSSFLTFS